MVKYNSKEINTNINSIRLITRKDRIVQNDISQQMLENNPGNDNSSQKMNEVSAEMYIQELYDSALFLIESFKHPIFQ